MSGIHRREQPYKDIIENGRAGMATPADRKAAKASGRDNTAFHFDEGKSRVDVLPTEALEAIGVVFGYGAAKYGEWNWAQHADEWDWNQLYASALRHLFAWQRGEDLDPESNLPHLAHAGCNILMLMQLIMAGLGNDDRNPIYKVAETVEECGCGMCTSQDDEYRPEREPYWPELYRRYVRDLPDPVNPDIVWHKLREENAEVKVAEAEAQWEAYLEADVEYRDLLSRSGMQSLVPSEEPNLDENGECGCEFCVNVKRRYVAERLNDATSGE
jgi:hypothetical protein